MKPVKCHNFAPRREDRRSISARISRAKARILERRQKRAHLKLASSESPTLSDLSMPLSLSNTSSSNAMVSPSTWSCVMTRRVRLSPGRTYASDPNAVFLSSVVQPRTKKCSFNAHANPQPWFPYCRPWPYNMGKGAGNLSRQSASFTPVRQPFATYCSRMSRRGRTRASLVELIAIIMGRFPVVV